MKKLILILCAVVVLIGAGIYFIMPTNINWDKYGQELRDEVKARTGLTIAYQGTPVFTMKPSAMLKLNNVRLGNVQGASYPQLMTASNVEIQFDTTLLFRRKIKIKKIVLSMPKLYFETLSNGKWNWQAAFFDNAGRDGAIGFDSMLVSDGVAEIKTDKYSPIEKWTRVNAELFADSARGPFFFEGSVGALATSVGFSLKVDKFQAGTSPDFTLKLINAPAEASIQLSGKYGLSPSDLGMLTGSLNFDIRKPDQIFALFFPDKALPPELFQPVVGNFKLSSNPKTRITEYADFLFKYGTSSASGKLTVRTLSPQEASERQSKEEMAALADDEDIVLRDPSNPTVAVNIDEAPVSRTKLAENLLPKVYTASFIFSRLDADPFFSNLWKIADFMTQTEYFGKTQDELSLTLTLDTVNYKRDVIHSLKGEVLSSPEGLSFKNFSTNLPGNGYAEAAGTLALTKKTPLFSGNVSAEFENISAFLRWIGINDLENIPQNLLRHFKGKTELKLAENGVILKNTSAEMDQMTFDGGLSLRFGARLGIALDLNVNDLDATIYFPEKSKQYAAKKENWKDLPALTKVKNAFTSLAELNNFDGSLKLNAARFSFADIDGEKVEADLSVVRGLMKINKFSAKKIFSAAWEAQGTLTGFGGEPQFDQFGFKINTLQLGNFIKETGIKFNKELDSQDNMRLSADLTGNLKQMAFKASGDWNSFSVTAQGTARDAGVQGYVWEIDGAANHKNFRNFIRLFSDKYRPVLSNPGAVSVKGHLLKDGELLQSPSFEAVIGDSAFKGTFKLENISAKPVLTASLDASVLAPMGLLPNMNLFENSSVFPVPTSVVDLFEKVGYLSRILKNGSFSEKAFDFSFLGDYSATVNLKANRFYLNDLDLSAFDAVLKISSGDISLDVRRSLLNKANLGGIFKMQVNGPELIGQAAVRLSGLDMPAKAFDFSPLDIGKVEQTVLNLNVSTAGKNMRQWADGLSGKGELSFKQATVYGWDFSKLKDALPTVTKENIDTVSKAVSGGQSEVQNFASTLAISGGSVVLNPVDYVLAGRKNQSSLSYNYITGKTDGSLSVATGIHNVPDVKLTLTTAADGKVVLADNVKQVFQFELENLTAAEEVKRKKIAEEQSRQAMQLANEQLQLKNRLKELDQNLTAFLAEQTKRQDNLERYAKDVYEVKKYKIPIDQVITAIHDFSEQIQTLQGRQLLDEARINAVQNEIELQFFKKSDEIRKNFDSGMLVGVRGIIFDMVSKANLSLVNTAKLKTANPDIKEIETLVNEGMGVLEKIKAVQKQAEGKNDYDQLVLMSAEAEVFLNQIQDKEKQAQALIKARDEKQAAEEKAKQDALEAKRKAEEALKKKAEEEEAARKAKEAAEIKKRQSTIYRRGEKTGVNAEASLKPQEAEVAVEKTEPPVQKKTTAAPTIIRRK